MKTQQEPKEDPLDLCRQDLSRVDATLVALLRERKRLADMFERIVEDTCATPANARDTVPK